MKRMITALLFVVLTATLVLAQQNFTTDDIANTALQHEGEYGGQCKVFVQSVISELGGTLGAGYRDAYMDQRLGYFEISLLNDAVRGDIIQVSYDPNPSIDTHVHTAIILKNNGNGTFNVIHSNFDQTNIVTTRDNWSPFTYAANWSGWSAHFYRLGRLVTCQYQTAIQLQSSWIESVHGFAVTLLYQWGSFLRQDFQYTVMFLNPSNGSVIIDGTNWVCPGMTEQGWNWSITPYFVKAYNDHGRANTFGQAFSDAGNSRYAHLWGEYWIHNWNYGSLGECALMLDPALPANKKQAAPIHGRLWNWFRYNGGPYYVLSNGKNLGCVVEPEEYANAGVNFDVIQVTSNGYLYWDEWVVTAHPREIVVITGGQDPTPTPTPTPINGAASIEFNPPPTVDCLTDGYLPPPIVKDENGQVLPNVAWFIISANCSILAVSSENGYYLGNSLGTTQVWAEVADARWIKSAPVNISVVEPQPPQPIQPDIFPSAPLRLNRAIVITNPLPYVQYYSYSAEADITNTTNQPISFYRPFSVIYELNGKVYNFSAYLNSLVTLQPGESGHYLISGGYFPPAGDYYLRIHVRLEGSAVDQWHWIDQAVDGVSTKLYFSTVTEAEIPAELVPLGIWREGTAIIRGQVLNNSQVDITQPFTIAASIVGQPTQHVEVPQLPRVTMYTYTFDFGTLPSVTHTVDVWFDSFNNIPEIDESNNHRTLTFTIEVPPSPKPDLAPSLLLLNTAPTAADSIELGLFVPNDGEVESPISQVLLRDDVSSRTWWCDVPTIQPMDVWDTILNIGPLSVGNHNLTLTVDPANVVVESHEDNNTTSTLVYVAEPPKPDLFCEEFDVLPYPRLVGTNLQLEMWVEEINGVDFPGGWLKVLYEGSELKGQIPFIPANQGVNVIVPLGQVNNTGTYSYTITLNVDQKVPEESEANNQASGSFTVTQPPNLTSQLRLLTSNPTTQNDLIFEVTIINGGEGIAMMSHSALRLFNLVTPHELVPPLAYGQNYTYQVNFGKQPAGTIQFIAHADILNEVAESNEQDNDTSLLVTVLPSQPADLIVESISWTPNDPQLITGKTYALKAVISNIGQGAAGSFNVEFRIGGETYPPKYPVSGLNPGQKATVTRSFTPKTAMTYGVTVTADINNTVSETNETNNKKVVLVTAINPVTTPLPADAWDPGDNTVSGSTALNNPTTSEQTHGPHTLSSTDKYDWFKVYLTAGVRYNFNTTGSSGDNYGELYSNSAGTTRVAYNDDSGGNLQFSLTCLPTVTGWYYLRVRAYSVGSNCSYSLKYRRL
ncbi:MAG: hypothetical protein HY979_03265 [Candidatus Magasanikbacteria bacterium]|nr:hypothetical protein [Candidatus Magasanikbacteria bacterium]